MITENGIGGPHPSTVEAYLYRGFRIDEVTSDELTIVGVDHTGFTAEAIRDRLASGLFYAEVTQ